MSDPFGREAAFDYDDYRNLVKLTDMGGYWTELTYDQNVFINRISNARGTWNILNEPADGGHATGEYPTPGASMGENFRITLTNPLGYQEEYYYCGLTSPTYSWHVAPKNYVPYVSADRNNWQTAPKTIYKYTTLGVPQISRIEFPAGGTVDYAYDAAGNRNWENYSDSGIFQYTYNPKGLITKISYPWVSTSNFTYAPNGVDLVTVQDSRGTVALTYDDAHCPTSVTDRLGNQTTFSYNGYGQLTGSTDPLGIITSYVYGPDHHLQEVLRDGQRLSQATRDALGRVQSLTDATGLALVLEYNNLNQVTQMVYPDNRSINFTYSSCCPYLLDSVTDRSGRTVSFSYDKLSRLSQKTFPDGNAVRFAYDPNGNLSELLDPKGNVTRFKYNFNDWLTMKMYADGDYVLFNYDNKGVLLSQSTARGTSIFYEYSAGRLWRVKLPASNDPEGMLGTNYIYDQYSRITWVQRPYLGSVQYTYDANSRLTAASQSWGY